MTVYNEAEFIPASLPAMIESPHVASITIVEGAYQEFIRIGRSARSTDGTVGLIMSIVDAAEAHDKVAMLQTNQESDTHQRNAGLNYIRDNLCNFGDGVEDYLFIVDGDEVWEDDQLAIAAKVLTRNLDVTPVDCVHVKSRTFVNDFDTYTWHEFPRFFRMTPGCRFVNDNYMDWEYAGWFSGNAQHLKLPISYFHYSFMRPPERIQSKIDWWNTRFGDREFTYDWAVEDGKATTTGDYGIYEFTGQHPVHTRRAFSLGN